MRAFVIHRDRAVYAHLCITALIEANLEPTLVDQGSSWPPALEYLEGLEASGVQVLRRGGGHPRSLWSWQPFIEACGNNRYVVTDCDTIPSDDCPLDWPARLSGLLDRHPEYDKIGLGLRLDRIPGHYPRRDHVLTWEQQYWDSPLDGAQVNGAKVYRAPTDTTLAVYPPLTGRSFGMHALRTGHPYVADHVAWYEDYGSLDDELRYYHEHAEPGISHWTTPGRSVWGR